MVNVKFRFNSGQYYDADYDSFEEFRREFNEEGTEDFLTVTSDKDDVFVFNKNLIESIEVKGADD